MEMEVRWKVPFRSRPAARLFTVARVLGPMRVITLGTAAAGVPRAGDAGTGNLVEHGDTRVLVDCGSGVLGELVRHAPLPTLQAVYLTHLHADHILDLYPLTLWARFSRHRLKLFGPPGTRTLLYRWFSLFTDDPDPYVQTLDLVEYEAWKVYAVGELKFMPCPVEHNAACFAFRAEAGGARFVFSGDTRVGALLQEAVQGADLFLSEATFQDLPEDATPEKSRDHHMTAREAGLLASRAEVGRLVLTHIKFDLDPEVSRKQGEEGFGGPVDIATPGAVYEVEARQLREP